MAKFKVGDRVVGNEKASKYNVTKSGTEWIVAGVGDRPPYIYISKDGKRPDAFFVDQDAFTLVMSPKFAATDPADRFKEGDWVAVYGVSNGAKPIRVVATVVGFWEDGTLRLTGPGIVKPGDYDFTVAHPRQCRKLKPKARRRVFLTEAALQTFACGERKASGDIEFLEVPRKKKGAK